MQTRLTKPWTRLDAENVQRLWGYLGVYEIQDSAGETVLIAYAGGRSPHGLRGELQRELLARGEGFAFRYEVNMQYMTRYKELLMVYVCDHGQLPRENRLAPPSLGRLSPAEAAK